MFRVADRAGHVGGDTLRHVHSAATGAAGAVGAAEGGSPGRVGERREVDDADVVLVPGDAGGLGEAVDDQRDDGEAERPLDGPGSARCCGGAGGCWPRARAFSYQWGRDCRTKSI